MLSSLEAELNAKAIPVPVTKEPSSIISASESSPTISQTVSSILDTTNASLSNMSRPSFLTPEVQSGVRDSASSQSLQTTNFDVHTVQVPVPEPMPSGSTEEALKSLPKATSKMSRGSTSYHHNRNHVARGKDGAHQGNFPLIIIIEGTHTGNTPNGASVYTHQGYRKHAPGRGNGIIGAAPHSRLSSLGMDNGKVPNGVPQRNHRNVGSHFRGRGAKVIK